MENTSFTGRETDTAGCENKINDTDARVIKKIKRILDKGNNAEVKKRKDGTIAVYEVKKVIV